VERIDRPIQNDPLGNALIGGGVSGIVRGTAAGITSVITGTAIGTGKNAISARGKK
jgi:hypothetical protein